MASLGSIPETICCPSQQTASEQFLLVDRPTEVTQGRTAWPSETFVLELNNREDPSKSGQTLI
jgi:hypothetical protein